MYNKSIRQQDKEMKSNLPPQWTIRLRVSPEERKQIQKEAIDRDLSIAEYIKLKVLESDSPTIKRLVEGKSA